MEWIMVETRGNAREELLIADVGLLFANYQAASRRGPLCENTMNK